MVPGGCLSSGVFVVGPGRGDRAQLVIKAQGRGLSLKQGQRQGLLSSLCLKVAPAVSD